MLKKIQHILLKVSQAAGVEAVMSSDGKLTYSVIVLYKHKNVVSATVKESGIEDLQKLKSLIPSDIPAALVINGRGILHKKLSDQGITKEQELVTQVLPNAKEADFLIQKINSGKNVFISLIRKDTFQRIIDGLSECGIQVVAASCGPFLIQEILPVLKETEEVKAGNYILTIKNHTILDFKLMNEASQSFLEIGGEKIEDHFLMAYANALYLFFEEPEVKGIQSERVHGLAENFQHQKLFKITGYSTLVGFVVLMLANYLCYNYFNSSNNELSAQSSQYDGMFKEISFLETQVKEKEYFLQRAGWLSVPRTSYFADQIAVTVPSSIKLKELKINPLNTALTKRERKNVFQSDTILVSGVCSNPTVLNPWMKELKNEPWILTANNVNYAHDHKTQTGNFEIEIVVANEF